MQAVWGRILSLGKGRHIGWTRAPVEKVTSGQIKNRGGPKVQNTTETQHSLFLFSHHCIMLECYSQQCPCVTCHCWTWQRICKLYLLACELCVSCDELWCFKQACRPHTHHCALRIWRNILEPLHIKTALTFSLLLPSLQRVAAADLHIWLAGRSSSQLLRNLSQTTSGHMLGERVNHAPCSHTTPAFQT